MLGRGWEGAAMLLDPWEVDPVMVMGHILVGSSTGEMEEDNMSVGWQGNGGDGRTGGIFGRCLTSSRILSGTHRSRERFCIIGQRAKKRNPGCL